MKNDPLLSSTPSESSSPVWFLTLLYPSAPLAKRPAERSVELACCLFINASGNRKASDVGCILSGDRLWTMRSCVKRHKLACKSGALQMKLPFYPLVCQFSGSLAKQLDHIFSAEEDEAFFRSAAALSRSCPVVTAIEAVRRKKAGMRMCAAPSVCLRSLSSTFPTDCWKCIRVKVLFSFGSLSGQVQQQHQENVF